MSRSRPILFALLLAAPFPAAAGPPRAALIAEPYEIYKMMLAYAEKGELGKVEKCLDHLSPLLAQLKGRLGVDAGRGLRRALAGKDKARVPAEVRNLIGRDIRAHLLDASEGSGIPRPASVRLAYLNYRVLAPYLREKDRGLARGIETRFKSLYRLLRYSKTGSEKEAGDHIRAIEEKLFAALSEEKGPDG